MTLDDDLPIDSLRLVLVRHGQTDSNVRHALDTALPGAPLNARGREQADTVAGLLAGWPVRAVFASRADRARQTAAPIAAAHGLEVTVVDGVHEVAVGDLEGRSDRAARRVFEEIYDAWWGGELTRRMPGGESAAELRERFLPVVEEITKRSADPDAVAGETIVLVSHGAAIRVAAAALLGDTVETRYVPNTGRVVLARDPGAPTGWSLQAWDSGPALPGDVTAGATD